VQTSTAISDRQTIPVRGTRRQVAQHYSTPLALSHQSLSFDSLQIAASFHNKSRLPAAYSPAHLVLPCCNPRAAPKHGRSFDAPDPLPCAARSKRSRARWTASWRWSSPASLSPASRSASLALQQQHPAQLACLRCPKPQTGKHWRTIRPGPCPLAQTSAAFPSRLCNTAASRHETRRERLCPVGGAQIASLVNRAGISNLTGLAGAANIQGEDQKKLDVISNDVFCNALRASGRTVRPACDPCCLRMTKDEGTCHHGHDEGSVQCACSRTSRCVSGKAGEAKRRFCTWQMLWCLLAKT